MFESSSVALAVGFVVVRAVPIIIPPLPGILIDFAGIAFFGSLYGCVLGLLGMHLGSVCAFFVARYHREWVSARMPILTRLHTLEGQYSPRQTFAALVSVRVFTSPLFDYVNYVAGFSSMSFRMYFFSTLVGTVPYAIVVYYIGESILAFGPVLAAGAVGALLIGLWFLKRKLMAQALRGEVG